MRLLIIIAALASLGAAGPPAPAILTPVAVELFTSQGCSSCPPADALAERLAREPNIILLTRPVTYWDRLGWKDTLAREENTQLQHDYAARGGTGSGVYTPQIMVQGATGVVGSEEAAVRRLIQAEKQQPGPGLRAEVTADGGRTVTINGATRSPSTITLIALKSEVVVRIGSGENGGRTVRYTNIVRSEAPVGRWTGGPMTFTIAGRQMQVTGADRYALILRDGPAGRIVAARYL
jgi:hypothetical protein